MEKFLEIYGALPRAGPGSNALTRKAWEMLKGVPPSPEILDLGCGPGAQTVELLKSSKGRVTAVDFLPQMIDRTRAAAEAEGFADRLETRVADMNELPFESASFDVIWSEGAIYNLGFELGLNKFRPLLKPGGFMAVSEVVWLRDDPPEELVEFWKAYPEIDSVEAKLEVIRRAGFEGLGHFIFPSTAWTEHYYDPMAVLVEGKAAHWVGDEEGEAVLSEARREIDVYQRFSEFFSYAFFTMRNPQVP